MCFHFIISITTTYYLMNTSRAMTIIAMLCVCSCSMCTCLHNDNMQPLAPKAKNFYFYYDVADGMSDLRKGSIQRM